MGLLDNFIMVRFSEVWNNSKNSCDQSSSSDKIGIRSGFWVNPVLISDLIFESHRTISFLSTNSYESISIGI